MKKFLILLTVLLTMNFSACGVDKPAQNNSDKITVVTTIFPVYDWTREIIGYNKNFDLILLGGTGIDLHSFQPSAQDIMKISTCDVLICVGGESDEWIDAALKQSTNKNLVVVKLLDNLGDKILRENHDGHVENDEHVWLSLKNAQILCEKISDALIKVDPTDEKIFRANVAAYNEKLAALDEKYRETISAAPVKTILFGDRFPFRYLCDDYGLKYFAAFAGCSAETEASFETIKFLADKVDELKLPCVLTIEGTNHKIAETIIANTANKSQKILVLDSMQSVADGNYLSTMEKNLEVLREALSK